MLVATRVIQFFFIRHYPVFSSGIERPDSHAIGTKNAVYGWKAQMYENQRGKDSQ